MKDGREGYDIPTQKQECNYTRGWMDGWMDGYMMRYPE